MTAPVPMEPCRRQNPSSLTAGRLRARGLMVTVTVTVPVPLRATGASESGGLESPTRSQASSSAREFKFSCRPGLPGPGPLARASGKSPALSRLRTLRVGMYHGASSVRALAAPAYDSEGRFSILVYLERPLAEAA